MEQQKAISLLLLIIIQIIHKVFPKLITQPLIALASDIAPLLDPQDRKLPLPLQPQLQVPNLVLPLLAILDAVPNLLPPRRPHPRAGELARLQDLRARDVLGLLALGVLLEPKRRTHVVRDRQAAQVRDARGVERRGETWGEQSRLRGGRADGGPGCVREEEEAGEDVGLGLLLARGRERFGCGEVGR